MSFKAVFETLPLVELPDWKGLRVTRAGPEGRATRTSTKEIDRLREEAARYDPVDEDRADAAPATSCCSTSPGSPSTAARAAATRTRSSRSATPATTRT